MDKPLEQVRILRKELRTFHNEILELIDCKDCKKGPCIGRLEPGETGYVHEKSLFFYDGHFCLDGCSILRKTAGSLSVEVTNHNGVFEVSTPTLLFAMRESIGPKDIPIGRRNF